MSVEHLQAILDAHPNLADEGFVHRKESVDRDNLLNAYEAIASTADWLQRHIRPTGTIRQYMTSYGMKHVMERATKKYVSNGEFIAAALLAGFRCEPCKFAGGPVNPNAHFNMAKRSWRSIERAVGMRSQ